MTNESKSSRLAARLFLCLIGGMLLLIGGVFEWLMIRSYKQASASREWSQVDAVVLRSVVDERQIKGSPPEYQLAILYGYNYGGKDFTSERLTPRGAKWLKDMASIEKLAEDFPEGSNQIAWVNPDQPEFAILKHDTKAAGYTIWFPALIMVGGAGMIFGAFRSSSTT